MLIDILLISLIALSVAGMALSHLLYRRSLRATVFEFSLRKINDGLLTDSRQAEQFLAAQMRQKDAPVRLPEGRSFRGTALQTLHGSPALIFQKTKAPARVILYLHGGAYIQRITPIHAAFCMKLAKRCNALVYAPMYPLAPRHTYLETYALLHALWQDLTQKNLPIVLMGDSAGGGLAAGFAMDLVRQHAVPPQKMLLISPWLDVSMSSSDYAPYQKADPILGADGLRRLGQAWAGEDNTRDPRVSPLFGPAQGLPPTLQFTGTNEIFYPDIMAFHQKLEQAGVPARLIIGRALYHVYPLYPIAEGRTARRQCIRFINAPLEEK